MRIILRACAPASALGGLLSVEDPRLTGGLLVFAGLSHGYVAYGLYRVYGKSSATVLPVGALTTCAVAWWCYGPLVRKWGLGRRELSVSVGSCQVAETETRPSSTPTSCSWARSPTVEATVSRSGTFPSG